MLNKVIVLGYITGLLLLTDCHPATKGIRQSSINQAVTVYTGQQAGRLNKAITQNVDLQYLLYLPEEYKQTSNKFPLILYLHGGSVRGEDVDKIRTMGLPAMLEQDKHFPFVVLSPLCPQGEIWTDADALIALLNEITTSYRIDSSRIYLTGHSMGGSGTWYLAYKHPEKFAAIAPMSAVFTIEAWAEKLRNTPVWAFHGDKDEIAPISNTEILVNELQALGGNVQFSVLVGADHSILDTYENTNLYDWFLEHHR